MSEQAHAPAHTAAQPASPTTSVPGLILQRCACGGTPGVDGECEACRAKRLQRKAADPVRATPPAPLTHHTLHAASPTGSGLILSQPDDSWEREADAAAEAVVAGAPATPAVTVASGMSVVQRDQPTKQTPAPPSDIAKLEQAAPQVGEAFLKTDFGKKLLDQAKELGEALISSLAGKILTGSAVVGAVSALAATHHELPFQLPAIPLDPITPGLSVKLTYTGPVDKPTGASVTFSYSPPVGGEQKKTPTASEQYRAETAKIAADQARFRAGMTYTPGSAEDLAAKAEKAAFQHYLNARLSSLLPGTMFSGTAVHDPKDDLLLMRAADQGTEPEGVPAIVHEVLATSGQPLDTATQAGMGARFGHDFSQVRVHTDARAAESAAAVNALAYTVGRDVVFGAGQYAPDTNAGQRLLAHELTHVVQQASVTGASAPTTSPLLLGSSNDVLEAAAQRTADWVASGQADSHAPNPIASVAGTLAVGSIAGAFVQRAPQPGSGDSIPPRGPNPADRLRPFCQRITRAHAPATAVGMRSLISQWSTDARACLQSAAPASNATHWQEILNNLMSEIDNDAQDLLTNTQTLRPSDVLDMLRESCQHRQREAHISFQYNVILEESGAGWTTSGSNWDDVEAAFAELPIEATWANPRLIRFRREQVSPQASAGAPGHGPTGGWTEPGPTETVVHVYDAGVGTGPYTRSAQLGLPATIQTIRHEVGHVQSLDIPAQAKRDLFENIMDWREYSWFWITNPPVPACRVPPYGGLQDERCNLCRELDFMLSAPSQPQAGLPSQPQAHPSLRCNDARLNQWLNGLQQFGHTQLVGARTYTRGDYLLHSVPSANLPRGSEFEYARTDREEYFAELYAYAVSRPQFLHSVLPPAQIAWLKREVFHTPVDLAREAALPEPVRTQFIIQGSQLFTREQLDSLMNRLLTAYSQPGAASA